MSHFHRIPSSRSTRADNEERKRGQAAYNRVKRTGVLGPIGVDRSKFGTQNIEYSCPVARQTSPGASARDSPRRDGEPSKARRFGFTCVHEVFGKCMWCASGPGGCTHKMLKVCLEDAETTHLLHRAAEDRAEAPQAITRVFMAAYVTALQKPDGEGGARDSNRNHFPKVGR